MTGRLGFIGAGRMAEAMIRGLIAKNVYSKDDIVACAPSESTRSRISKEIGIRMYQTAAEVAKVTDTVVLAIKPKQIPDLFREEGLRFGPEHLIVSIAAGVKICTLKTYVPDSRIIRVMPNHCCMVLDGAAGYVRGSGSTDEDVETVKTMFSALGLAVEVREQDLDAVTGVCGSSPAFMYLIISAIADVGVLHGLSESDSTELVAQSMIGAGRMVLESGKSPEKLIDDVCSPGGTTIEGMKVLDDLRIRSGIMAAVEAVIAKSEKMGKTQ